MKTTLNLLQDVRGLLADESNWIQGELARTKDDHSCDPSYSGACKFCLAGAIDKFGYTNQYIVDQRIIARMIIQDILVDTIGYRFLTVFNDNSNTTHADVIDVLDKAIEKAKADGS